jgi:hypothetical protein
MQREAGAVDARCLVEVVVHRHLGEVRGRHFGVEQFVPLHQEHARLARHPHRRMVIDHVVPAVMRQQPVNRGEVDARLPLLRRHACGHFARLRDSGR